LSCRPALRPCHHSFGRDNLSCLHPAWSARSLALADRCTPSQDCLTLPQRTLPMPKCFQAALALAVITLSAIASPPALAERLKVVATFTVIADMAKNVGGDRVEITTLVGPNGDTHVYEPRPADVVAMAKADVVLVNGLHFEGFLERLIETSATKGRIVELTRGITPIAFEPDGLSGKGEDHQDHDHAAREGGGARGHHDHDAADPHAFQSIPNAQIYVKNIADAFCA